MDNVDMCRVARSAGIRAFSQKRKFRTDTIGFQPIHRVPWPVLGPFRPGDRVDAPGKDQRLGGLLPAAYGNDPDWQAKARQPPHARAAGRYTQKDVRLQCLRGAKHAQRDLIVVRQLVCGSD